MNKEGIDIFKSNALYCKEDYHPFVKGKIYECRLSVKYKSPHPRMTRIISTETLMIICPRKGDALCAYFYKDDNYSIRKLLKHFVNITEHRKSIINELI